MVVKQDTGFTELINKSMITNDNKVIEEKMKGNFILNISTKLPEPLRIA
jgi:hypothetical protein